MILDKDKKYDSLKMNHLLTSLLLCTEQLTFNIKNPNQIIWPGELVERKIEKWSKELGFLTSLIEKSIETDFVCEKLSIVIPIIIKNISLFTYPYHK